MHHLMGHVSLLVGESATMASECAVMGVPAIYAANTGRGYTDEQEDRYGLVFNLRQLAWPHLRETIDSVLAVPSSVWQEKRNRLLREKIDVAPFVADLILDYPRSRMRYEKEFHISGKN
jgi:predicted glycosyltransferase